MKLTSGLFSVQSSTCQTEASRLRQALCFSVYQGFVFAYESMLASQVRLFPLYLMSYMIEVVSCLQLFKNFMIIDEFSIHLTMVC